MVINNFDLVRSKLDFSSFDYFYNIKIIVRNKDVGNDSPYSKSFTSHKEHTISWYTVRSYKSFDRCKDSIIELCNNNHFRAYIDLDTKSHSEASRNLLNKVQSDYIDAVKYKAGKDGKFKPLDALVRSCMTVTESNVGRNHSYVLLDLDDKNKYSMDYARIRCKLVEFPSEKTFCYETIAGYHIIVPLVEFNKWDHYYNKADVKQKEEFERRNGRIPELYERIMKLRREPDIEVKHNANALLYCNI